MIFKGWTYCDAPHTLTACIGRILKNPGLAAASSTPGGNAMTTERERFAGVVDGYSAREMAGALRALAGYWTEDTDGLTTSGYRRAILMAAAAMIDTPPACGSIHCWYRRQG